ncbi:hypothetical protein E2C01_061749 [Portunus trituberculatus]|uniref:Uncharacterized protein n=1 Tax=Portunus trituberculatus TaxID=210409 RepID=A0A5B7HBU9_PORTR|nr:hypothetical protein [Portunus trituberculatus]
MTDFLWQRGSCPCVVWGPKPSPTPHRTARHCIKVYAAPATRSRATLPTGRCRTPRRLIT